MHGRDGTTLALTIALKRTSNAQIFTKSALRFHSFARFYFKRRACGAAGTPPFLTGTGSLVLFFTLPVQASLKYWTALSTSS